MFPMIKIHQRSGDKRYFEKLVKWLRRKFGYLRNWFDSNIFQHKNAVRCSR